MRDSIVLTNVTLEVNCVINCMLTHFFFFPPFLLTFLLPQQEHCCVLNSILGWDSTVGEWARVEVRSFIISLTRVHSSLVCLLFFFFFFFPHSREKTSVSTPTIRPRTNQQSRSSTRAASLSPASQSSVRNFFSFFSVFLFFPFFFFLKKLFHSFFSPFISDFPQAKASPSHPRCLCATRLFCRTRI